MKTVLAITLRLTENSIARLTNLMDTINKYYCGISIATPPDQSSHLVEVMENIPSVKLFIGKNQVENRRYLTLKQALTYHDATHIHYCDGDHLLSRIDAFPDDWQNMLFAMESCDCLIVNRSIAVFESYPPALRETERIINIVASHLMNQRVDLGSGSRGFSRRAVEFLMKYTDYETHGVATDAEWTVLLYYAGFIVETYESDGAIYEIFDELHKQNLESVEQWAKRVKLANLIIEAGIIASRRTDIPDYPNI